MKKVLFFILLITSIVSSQTQIGDDIDGKFSGIRSGWSVSLSSDGSIVAIGNYSYKYSSGKVQVFKNKAGNWVQVGNDIDGEAGGDYSGYSISLSSDGNIIAIGAPYNNGLSSGHVRLFENKSSVWTQIGSDINGGGSGKSVSLSSNGNIVAIGCSNHVRIYKNISSVWEQVGDNINGEVAGDNFGYSVSLSSDGSIVAIGAYANNGNGNASGHVRVFKNETGNWKQIGGDIDGEAAGDNSGKRISLSSFGNIVAIGAWYNDGNGIDSGHVRVYEYQTGRWVQIGSDIDGEAAGDESGRSISLSLDGSIVAIGAVGNDGNVSGSGHVKIYKNNLGIWTQIGNDIDGEGAGDWSGTGVCLSSDGSIIAIGAANNDGNGISSGHVRIFNLSDILTSNEFILSQFELYPNPASKQFTIQLKEGLILEKVNVYNQLGEFIKEETQLIIDVSKLSKGLYLVEIITNKGKATKKVVVD